MSKETEFKRTFVGVLRDLQQHGSKDTQAMLLLGSLASDLSNNLRAKDWTQAKRVMSPALYNDLLGKFQAEGNAQYSAGRAKPAYALQALAVSLVASRQHDDPELQTGDELLDALINRAIALHRAQSALN